MPCNVTRPCYKLLYYDISKSSCNLVRFFFLHVQQFVTVEFIFAIAIVATKSQERIYRHVDSRFLWRCVNRTAKKGEKQV